MMSSPFSNRSLQPKSDLIRNTGELMTNFLAALFLSGVARKTAEPGLNLQGIHSPRLAAG
jgi:hypothetical protein